jgi:hypothetical protein
MARASKYPAEFRTRGVQLYRVGGPHHCRGGASWGSVRRRSASECVRTRRIGVRPRTSRPRRSWQSLGRLIWENAEL